MVRKILLFLVLSIFLKPGIKAGIPEIGAQIWIEPGQTKEQIEGWFKTLADNQMPVTRLFIMWNYVEKAPGVYSFTEYDYAFGAAEKYKVKVVATLMPNFGPPFRGYLYKMQDGSIPKTMDQIEEADVYIETVVKRYRQHKALDTWMLFNEPGQMPSPDPLAMSRYRVWLKDKYQHIDSLNCTWISNFSSFDSVVYSENWSRGGWTTPAPYTDWQVFWRGHLTWYLKRVADQVRKSDQLHGLHVNPHALLEILSKYDLPEWRKFLTSLGSSIHPVWHFGLLKRDQYGLGISYVCDLVRGAAADIPFWVTELQGGQNLFTASAPLRPRPEEIKNWLWSSIGSGADRTIFWCLNFRNKGTEAGEWGLLDWQMRPTARFMAAARVAEIMNRNKDFFSGSKPVTSDITLGLSLETMVQQERVFPSDKPDARFQKAHILAVMGVYRSLMESGIPVNICHMQDLNRENKGQILWLPHMSVLTAQQSTMINQWVYNGNTTVATGMTGLMNEQEKPWPLFGFPLSSSLGAKLKEFDAVNRFDTLTSDDRLLRMPVSYYVGEVDNITAKVTAGRNGLPIATRSTWGKGKTVWLPSAVDVGAYMSWSDGALSEWIKKEIPEGFNGLPVRFSKRHEGCYQRLLKKDKEYVSVIVNNSAINQSIKLIVTPGLAGVVIDGKSGWLNKDTVDLPAGETIVIRWK